MHVDTINLLQLTVCTYKSTLFTYTTMKASPFSKLARESTTTSINRCWLMTLALKFPQMNNQCCQPSTPTCVTSSDSWKLPQCTMCDMQTPAAHLDKGSKGKQGPHSTSNHSTKTTLAHSFPGENHHTATKRSSIASLLVF